MLQVGGATMALGWRVPKESLVCPPNTEILISSDRAQVLKVTCQLLFLAFNIFLLNHVISYVKIHLSIFG